MTLATKRNIVKQFQSGMSICRMLEVLNPTANAFNGPIRADIEQVLRDHLNGKFTLEPKRKAKR